MSSFESGGSGVSATSRVHDVAVTGAAGKTGLAVVAALSGAGHRVTALVRRTEQAEATARAGASRTRVVDLEDTADVAAALEGCTAAYHVPPNMHPDEVGIAEAVFDAATAVGARRLVLHSVLAPYLHAMPHHLRKARSEELLRRSALEWTILQPASYTQNLLGYVDRARSSGVLTVPYSASTPFTPVDLHDVAAVAAVVLADERHVHASYELCGPDMLTTAQMAEVLGGVLGRDVRAESGSPEQWRAESDLPVQERDDLAAMFGYYDTHGLVGGSFVLEHLLGRPATPLADALRRDLAAD